VVAATARIFFLSFLLIVADGALIPVDVAAGIKIGGVLPLDGQFDPGGSFGFDGRYRVNERWTVGFDVLLSYFPSDTLPYQVFTVERRRQALVGVAPLLTAAYFLADEIYVGGGVGRFGITTSETNPPNLTEVEKSDGIAGEIMAGWLYRSANRHHWLPFVELKYLFQEGASATYRLDTGEVRKYSRFDNLGLYVGITF
jgi:hypothetical protein